ncbi:carbohydrate ABC transporter permease [uncultured Leifsonia sp.]|uniref:carbohydrate ABC transporter permease n=1 Tax=Leifsonia sp. TaxID=1870902 RepID=UPI0028D28759|nr:carbohydrate ABC transporter permease [uncultured Leifsonia sp.]
MTTATTPHPAPAAPAGPVADRPRPAPARRSRRRPTVGRTIAWVYLAIIVLITIFPFYWMLRSALSNNYAMIANPSSPLPVGFTFGPFLRVLGLEDAQEAIAQGGSGATVQILHYLVNSVVYATLSTVLIVFFSLIAAYAFARLQWRGRELVFSLFLAALMVPGILTLLPNFVLIKELGLLNTFAGMILPGALFSAFNIFFLRQFMLGLSTEIEEAALLDGAGKLRILFRLTIPMTSGPIITLSILGFIGVWNDYFWPLLVTTDSSVQPLTLGLAVFKQSSPQTMPDWAGLMAATLVAALPMLILFMVFGKRIVNSIGFSGLK